MTERQAAPRVHTRDTRVRQTGLKGTEFVVFLVAVAAVLIAGLVVDGLNATETWRYFTYLVIGYTISRGLAKSGSRGRRASKSCTGPKSKRDRRSNCWAGC